MSSMRVSIQVFGAPRKSLNEGPGRPICTLYKSGVWLRQPILPAVPVCGVSHTGLEGMTNLGPLSMSNVHAVEAWAFAAEPVEGSSLGLRSDLGLFGLYVGCGDEAPQRAAARAKAQATNAHACWFACREAATPFKCRVDRRCEFTALHAPKPVEAKRAAHKWNNTKKAPGEALPHPRT